MNLEEIRLENQRVLLEPLAISHLPELLPVALQPGLTRYSPSKIDSEADLTAYLKRALDLREESKAIPFVVIDKKIQSTAGCTRYMNIDWVNKVLHIGSTWIGREFQGTGLNTEMKRLMIDYAFDELGFEKVEFRIDERNTRSRKAVEKLGAGLEGILRCNVYLTDGFKRNTCCYGLLPEEWTLIRKTLQI
ncbi:GNAT family N-acetyltransferase [Muriicola marianensis]|uniref:GCN5 family acetyltransferase n=1 Tax=Muriicola marianensis TaxID=1324801 RepID=A0ABQ1QPT6_9FLAO|nr:GNAT family N-acetyltransferase [Muriicola marianensis]GGD37694.1 GCN5 family acetyltransferase [Muriicola marianensis]